MKRWVVALATFALLTACEDGSGDSTPSPTATRTLLPLAATSTPVAPTNPFSIVGPVVADEFFDEILRPPSHFVLDAQTGLVYDFEFDFDANVQLKSDVYMAWRGNDPAIVSDGFEFRISLSGVAAEAVPHPDDDDNPLRYGGSSSTGAWTTGTLASGAGGVVFGDAARNDQFHISAAQLPEWAPTRDLLAVHGNLCDDNDILILDPATHALTNVTTSLPPVAGYVAWKEDSSALAVFAPRPDGGDIIDVSLDGASTPLLSVASPVTLIPIQWSPDARYLIVLVGYAPFTHCTTDWGGDSQVDQNFGGP